MPPRNAKGKKAEAPRRRKGRTAVERKRAEEEEQEEQEEQEESSSGGEDGEGGGGEGEGEGQRQVNFMFGRMPEELAQGEKAFLQIMLARGCVSDPELQMLVLEDLRLVEAEENWGVEQWEVALQQLFRKLNQRVGRFGLEMRSLVVHTVERSIFHALVNKAADEVVHAGQWHGVSAQDVALFQLVIDTIKQAARRDHHTITLQELREAFSRTRKSAASVPTVPALRARMQQWTDEHWLTQAGGDEWELGPRSFMELKELLEATVSAAGEEGDDDHEYAALNVPGHMQILYY